ncbi:proteinaceous RNase P 1, chloroplastic/mitochondrial-like [Quillaja saponaria]|uniref:ribonuclease P n=1 Tax=Quillaja saponaria TaxID=32244 RepID=A0AAD7VJM2_QUISA|nr:proteinaceous RNase P 1, chloroplastic/mitochondrial-like [Quillaja saponaria]KAJ7978248.1 proteinaceous RNase P 1, chloroplastic/mitochondrial-like [Quillaja saponaria]
MLGGSSSLTRATPLFSFFTRSPLFFVCWDSFHASSRALRCHTSFIMRPVLNKIPFSVFSMNRATRLSTSALPATSSIHESSSSSASKISNKSKKKARQELPETLLRHKINMCSKNGNIIEALRLYDEARKNGVPLNQHIYNVLLYLCSSSQSAVDLAGDVIDENVSIVGLKRGFEIFQQMIIDKVSPNEATFTSAARLAIAKEDPEMAFELVKQMKRFGIPPKLRSYGPALIGFCKKGEADKAYEVDAHMVASGVMAEEPELSALLKVSSETKNADKVYDMLHRMRISVRQVSESTLDIIEDWFKSEDAAKIGEENWNVDKVREGLASGGGGWHGHGWLGSGKWNMLKTQMDESGMCYSCGEKLVSIDIDPKETENFATSLTRLACQREVKADFNQFQEWLQQHGPFDAVVDGANVGLVNQHNFSFFQLNSVVKQLHQMSPSKRLPLIILHRGRVTGGPALNPNNKKLLESWEKAGALYATPPGSNDDWYWLYATVSCKCLLVTNDEMRDHLFQLLGTSFFPRWKERHQVRLSVSRRGPSLHLPPPYSIVIQESARGSWHIPTVTGDDLGNRREWLCLTRSRNTSNLL